MKEGVFVYSGWLEKHRFHVNIMTYLWCFVDLLLWMNFVSFSNVIVIDFEDVFTNKFVRTIFFHSYNKEFNIY